MDSQVAVKAIIQNGDGAFLIAREGKRWQAIGGRLEHWINNRPLETIVAERWQWQPGWTYVIS